MVRGRAERGEQLSGVRAAGVAVGERPSSHRSNGNSECVTSVWVEWGLLFIMTEGHVVYLLREKANADKLAILYERKLYRWRWRSATLGHSRPRPQRHPPAVRFVSERNAVDTAGLAL